MQLVAPRFCHRGVFRVAAESASAAWIGSLDAANGRLEWEENAQVSAVDPAKPAITLPPTSFRTFLAVPLTMVGPMDTWPSPATTVLPPLRTARIVVPCQSGKAEVFDIAAMLGV